jgi:hypothetical protein
MVDVTNPPRFDSGFASPQTEADVAMEQGGGAPHDAVEDVAAPEAAMTAEMESGVDSGADAVVDAGTDVAYDAGSDAAQEATNDAAGQDSGTEQGPRCLASDGSFYFCAEGEHCCVNAATRAASCATSCDSNSGLHPVDCPGASGDGGCGSRICCGIIVFNGGVVPNCRASRLTSACVDSCDAGIVTPGSTGVCTGAFAIRFCTAAADCADDPNGNTSCCNFGNPPSPVNWCVTPLSTVQLAANSCL